MRSGEAERQDSAVLPAAARAKERGERKTWTNVPGEWLHEGLAVACSRRFFGRGIPAQELLQEARAAICLAQERFDPKRGCCFSTYAVPVVMGALRAYCRRVAFTHPASCLNAWYKSPFERRPDTSPETLLSGGGTDLRTSSFFVGMDLESVPAALLSTAGFEDRLLLRDAIRRLGSPYAQVIGLRYFCGMNQRETGQRLGVAQWQVCRWEKMGLGMLREGMKQGK